MQYVFSLWCLFRFFLCFCPLAKVSKNFRKHNYKSGQIQAALKRFTVIIYSTTI